MTRALLLGLALAWLCACVRICWEFARGSKEGRG